ncbi:Glycosyl transferase family 2 [anaerobic digester metagenome]
MVKMVFPSESSLNDEYIIVESPELDQNGCIIDLDNLPKVSFCIPTLNNEDTIEKCLSSIANQNYPSVEIIVVDGNSTDKTIEIAKKYTNQIFFDSGLLGSARQTGVEKATGEIVALFDSDIIIPHKNWLRNAVRCFNYDDRISTVWPENVAPPDGGLVVNLYFNHWKLIIEDRIKKRRGLYGGGNALFLRRAIEEIGGVSRSLHWGEDFDWAQKLKDRGYKVVYIHDPLYHDTMPSLKVFTKKQFTGAKTFTKTGFQLMDLSPYEVFYEQVVLGVKGMFQGLIVERDLSWCLYPVFVSLRGLAYGYTYIVGMKER